MIRHVLKLVWNRKRANALIIIEIFFSFLVVFGVLTAAAALLFAWRKPLGYEWKNLWTIRVSFPDMGTEDKESVERNRNTILRFIKEIEQSPEVEAAAASNSPPYSLSTWESGLTFEGRKVHVVRDFATDGYAKTLGIKVLKGRWFEQQDDAATYVPMVIDADLAEAAFPGKDPIGQKFDEVDTVEYRVVGVVTPFRKDGEFSHLPMNMAFERVSLTAPKNRVPRNIVIKLRPGVRADFEEALNQRLHQVAPDISFRIRHTSSMRTFALRLYLLPVIIGSVVALFLIAMVTLGLTGVLWQNVTRRTREIGLRRALGATGPGVRRQVFSEVAMLATLALVAGVVIVGQLPALGIFRLISPAAFSTGIAGSLAMIYGLTLLCGAYPGWLASRLQPAEALRYE
jgi:putative ABC transport system permease protein